MMGSLSQWLVFLLAGLLVCTSHLFADETERLPEFSTRIASTPQELSSTVNEESLVSRELPNEVNAVIYPYQSATLGSEVRGIVDRINFQEGDPVSAGALLAEVSPAKYEAVHGEFKSNEEAIARTLAEARSNLRIREDLYQNRACTQEDVDASRFQVQVLEARYEEAKFKTEQSRLNLQACRIKAPFSGLIAVRYRDSHETVDFLEKILEVVDISKVYARANWPEAGIPQLAIGKRAYFSYRGKSYEGKIARIAPLIDPASKSKRVHVLLENPDNRLEVGMSGSVKLADPE
ncbi:MAG: efflux RND transporter periplasmic adaptor subunit [Desulfomonilaceae bacterium]|nr:efflux RND transporter periplasmic adaptor subunit [Desulfomonilaceae bacterium]